MTTNEDEQTVLTFDSQIETELDLLRQAIEDLKIEHDTKTRELNSRIDNLERRSRQGNQTAVATRQRTETLEEFQIGDTVRILSETNGLRGYLGQIIKITNKQFQIRLNFSEETVYRFKHSVERVL